MAQELGRTPAQVAVRWVLEQPAITSALVGARTVEQLRDSLGATQWRLEGDALRRLDEVSRLPMRYPKSMETPMKDRRDKAIKMGSL